MDIYKILGTHIEAVAWSLGVPVALIAVWLLLNSEGFGRFLMGITVRRASPEKNAARREALRPGLTKLAQQRAPFAELKDSNRGFALTLSDPASQTNPIWLWEVRWIGDHPFNGPAYEVEVVANPEHLRMARDKAIYVSAHWAVRAVASHLEACAANESLVRRYVQARYP